MKLEVGMYCRNKTDGYRDNPSFIKIKRLDNSNDSIVIYEKDSLEDYIYVADILKSSHNLIELLEVGDYVNGLKITQIYNCSDGKVLSCIIDNYYLDEEPVRNYRQIFKNNDIETVVTKEYFNDGIYEVYRIEGNDENI